MPCGGIGVPGAVPYHPGMPRSSLPSNLRVALIQQETVWQDPAANLARARGFVAEAARAVPIEPVASQRSVTGS